MTESETHKFIKNKIALALEELGYTTEQEKHTDEGRLDVYAKKNDNEINIEVYKTHISNWIIAKVKGEIQELEVKRIYKKKGETWLDKNLPVITSMEFDCAQSAVEAIKLGALETALQFMKIRYKLWELGKMVKKSVAKEYMAKYEYLVKRAIELKGLEA